jgi:hypothetical protein
MKKVELTIGQKAFLTKLIKILNYFLAFKKTLILFAMELFINELSLHGQYHVVEDFEKAVKEFTAMFSYINEQVKEKKLYKDSLFVQREVFTNTYFTASFEQLRKKDLKENFRRIIFNQSNPKDWRKEQKHHVDEFYVCSICDENDGLVSDTSLAEAAERELVDEGTKHILLNFIDSRFSKYLDETIEVVKNKNEITCLLHFESRATFENWISHNFTEPTDIFLRDLNRFTRTKYSVQGATVFQEKITDYYWYLDNFHKTEFEVFDSIGKHLFVTDLEGNKISEAKKGRKISFV